MAKSVKKKTNRRLKRSVRRTLGALCMITAIIVAAIPFPDAAAANEDTVADGTGGSNYNYDVGENEYIPIEKEIDGELIKADQDYSQQTDKIHKAYTVYQNSSRAWQMDWQFEYYAEIDADNRRDGLITKYNDKYAQETVDLKYQVYSDYIYITQESYDAFFDKAPAVSYVEIGALKNMDADLNNLQPEDYKIEPQKVPALYYKYRLDGSREYYNQNPDDEAYQFFRVNLPIEMGKYFEAYEAYELDPNNVSKPSPLESSYFDIIPEEKRIPFLCYQVFGSEALELVPVNLISKGKIVYMPQLAAGVPNPSTLPANIGSKPYWITSENPKEGRFLADKANTISGIAKGAFQNVQNVKTLTMAKEINFIGNSAFENSFVESVTFVNGTQIGNRAFKDCKNLTTIDMTAGVTVIGAEAFSGASNITDVVIPNSVTIVGAGAFNNCPSLQNISFTNIGNTKIDKFAFFDCPQLSTVDFGKTKISSIGNHAFALNMVPTGNMVNFDFPNLIDDGDQIGDYVLGGRTNLQNVTMPTNLGTSKQSELKATIFDECSGLASVIFPDTCYYVFFDKEIFEDVRNPEFYVRGPKTDGPGGTGGTAKPRESTWSCKFGDPAEQKSVPYVYTENGIDYYEICDEKGYLSVIDGKGTLVSSSFMPGTTPSEIGEVTVDQDGNWTVTNPYEIPATVGKIPVTNLKDGCFDENNTLGIKNWIVAFKIEDGSGIKSLGDNVFKEAERLEYVYIGDGVASIGKNTFANVENLGRVEIGKTITSIGDGAFENCPELEYMKFAVPDTITDMAIGKNAFSTGGEKLTIEGLIHEQYGPYKWAMDPSCFMDPDKGVRVLYKSPSPQNMSVILDNINNMPTLVDYPHFGDLPKDLRDRYENKGELTVEEASLVDACLNIKVPNGVKSVDAAGYFNDSSEQQGGNTVTINNQHSIAAYFTKDNGDLFKRSQQYKDGGLFSGAFDEYTETGTDKNPLEQMDEGNDRIKTVELPSVTYLPDGCFYSCENLESVLISDSMQDIGSLPFEYCTSLLSVGGGSAYSCNNGILYKNNPDGSKLLVECLASRGGKVGTPTVSLKNDPDLLSVTEIAKGAFRNCNEINTVDFKNGGTTKFTSIPEECFKGAKRLVLAYLPESVKFIGKEAFADSGITDVWVYNRNALLGEDVYKNVEKPKLTAYEDATIREQAKEQGIDVSDVIPEDGSLVVTFYVSSDNKLIEVSKITGVMPGSSVRKQAPDEIDLKDYIKEGYELTGWEGTEDIENVTQNCMFVAKITAIEDPDDPDDPDNPNNPDDPDNPNKPNDPNKPGGNNNNNGNNNGSVSDNNNKKKYTLTVVYGNGSGTYESGSTVIISAIEPPAGKEFYKWESNNTGVTITSATSAATTVKTTDSDAVVTATYRDKSTVSGNSTINRRPIGSSTSSGGSGTSVQITKPGVSNTDKAYASVSGSTDNFIVKITESAEAANAVATALANEYADMNPIKYFAMDISLYDKNGNQVTNTNGLSVNITMPIPDALVQYGGNNKVGAVVNGNTLEKLNCKFTTVSGIPCVTFTATHFSPYTIYVDTSNLSVNTLDTTPKTGDGIHPKWFLSLGLACISLLLFMKKDKIAPRKVLLK